MCGFVSVSHWVNMDQGSPRWRNQSLDLTAHGISFDVAVRPGFDILCALSCLVDFPFGIVSRCLYNSSLSSSLDPRFSLDSSLRSVLFIVKLLDFLARTASKHTAPA